MGTYFLFCCDVCGKRDLKATQVRRIEAAVDCQFDEIGTTNHYEHVDLCIECLRKEVQQSVIKMEYDAASNWITTHRKFK